MDSVLPAIKKGTRLSVDQRLDRRRPPVVIGNLVVRPRERVNSAICQAHEALHLVGRWLSLPDQSPDHAQDIADPVVELGDEDFLFPVRSIPLSARLTGKSQHNLDKRGPKRLGDPQLWRGERLAVPL